MKRTFLLIAIFCFTLSCDRYPDPSFENLTEYYFHFVEGSGQKFLAGDLVSDSVKFMAVRTKPANTDSVMVIFDVVKGGGHITYQSAYTDSSGLASTGWTLGYQSFEQKLRAATYDLSGHYLTSSYLTEYGFRNDTWDTCSFYPDGNMVAMAADTISKLTYMISGGQLWKQGSSYFVWDQVETMAQASPVDINIDRNGVLYITASNGTLIKSTDHGASWKTCTKPYPDYPYNIYSSVSNDNYVWAFEWNHPTKYSRDGGESWSEAGSDLASQGYGDVFRLKDGSLLFHGSNCCSLHRSFDDGLTWTKIETPGYSIKLYVDDHDYVYIVTQENGISIYRSTDYCATFEKVHQVYPEWGTSSNNNIFNKWGNYYYIIIPGYGILKSYDLVHYEDYWRNPNLIDLLIDHKGVLLAKYQNMFTLCYRNNTVK